MESNHFLALTPETRNKPIYTNRAFMLTDNQRIERWSSGLESEVIPLYELSI